SCGVHPGIAPDLSERFSLLAGEHNGQCERRWRHRQEQATTTTQSNP
ncbi:MAG: hypothetical protein JO250_10420, partial [Armatimonadetes bacterium]|nr:hypothetical protein [Armatimonadota bacterium]MBV9849422.1 hypothetical protein [Armatimonadota bacterium]MBV9849553.1 hypothetical protein [Armatimonadota bacterium]MBV9849707.1 hypothetical protein [Armatimonadota bacterium]MBV9850075.1 hypothetical protein [Armatimonadota bacterium]